MTNHGIPCCPGLRDVAPSIEMASSFGNTSLAYLLMDPCNTAAMGSSSLSNILSLFTKGNEWKSWGVHVVWKISQGEGFLPQIGALDVGPSMLVWSIQMWSHIFITEQTYQSNPLHQIFKVGVALVLV